MPPDHAYEWYTDEHVERARLMRVDGYRYKEIAKALGRTESAIERMFRRRQMATARISDARWVSAITSSSSYAQVMTCLGVCRTSVALAIRRLRGAGYDLPYYRRGRAYYRASS